MCLNQPMTQSANQRLTIPISNGSAAMSDLKETCENCGRPIDRLETPWVSGQRVVCPECWEQLQPSWRRLRWHKSKHEVQAIERTSKIWKIQNLVGKLLAGISALVIIVSLYS